MTGRVSRRRGRESFFFTQGDRKGFFLQAGGMVLAYGAAWLFMFVVMRRELPLYAFVRSVFSVFLAIDFLVGFLYRKSLSGMGANRRRLLSGLYFLPLLLLAVFCAGLCFEPLACWPSFPRTYLMGIVLVLFAVHFCYGIVWCIVAIFLYLKLVAGKRAGSRGKGARAGSWERARSALPHAAALLALSVFVYAMVISTFNLRIDRIDLRQENPVRPVPEGLRGYKILQFSDLHIGSFTHPKQVRALVKQAVATRPDMVVFTGDMVNFSTSEMEPFLDELSHLQAPDGVYCVLGNHDYGNYAAWPDRASKYANVAKMLEYYRKLGWVALNNASVKIDRGGDTLHIVGVENWGKGKRFPKRGKLQKALEESAMLYEHRSRRGGGSEEALSPAGPGGEGGVFTVLLSHDPSHFDSVVYLRYPKIDLTLAGHTHGMQVGMRINGRDYSPARLVYEHYSGLYRMANGQALYVNTGCGFNGLPFRLGMRPNMTLFLL